MAKKPKSTASYTLKFGHPTPFRRTVKIGEESVQLLFVPGEHYELTAEEVAGLDKEISGGLLVPTDLNEAGAQRPPRGVSVDAAATIERLEAKIEDLSGENAQLRADLEKLTAPAE